MHCTIQLNVIDLMCLVGKSGINVGNCDLQIKETSIAIVDVIGLEVVTFTCLESDIGLSCRDIVFVEIGFNLMSITRDQSRRGRLS